MSSNKNKPIIALMYDFDKTLCPRDMQEFTFIPSIGMTPKEFWSEVRELSENEHMDNILAYMYLMLRHSNNPHVGKAKPIRKTDFEKLGKGIEFYKGVYEWFDEINKYAKEKGAIVEHYIISSGLAEIIRGTKIGGKFKEIFACEFLYDASGVACWPKNVVNYTTKTQFVFRINKGELDISDNDRVNEFVYDEDRRIPFSNMIYIGDGMTDVPCMKVVRSQGGHSVAVYNTRQDVALTLVRDGRANYACEADYSKGSDLCRYVQDIIDKICIDHKVKTKESTILHKAKSVKNGSYDI